MNAWSLVFVCLLTEEAWFLSTSDADVVGGFSHFLQRYSSHTFTGLSTPCGFNS